MAKKIKEIHPSNLICYKVGNFYKVFGKDSYIVSYIVSYLFEYKIQYVQKNIPCLGFPVDILSKIIAKNY